MKKACGFTILLSWILLWGWGLEPSTFAQTARAAVRGTLRDESGAILPGVTITARNLVTNTSRTVVSDARGYYELSLDAGNYEMLAVLPGFRSEVASATIAEGETRTVDLVLEIAPFAETVTVTRTEQNLSEVPSAISVVLGDEIQFAQRRVSPAEALNSVPGLFAENRNNFSATGGVQLKIRAPLTSTRGIQVLQDGIPLTTADGTTQLTNMDLGSEGAVEVIRGPSSVLYGNSAGGVISFRTEFPSSDRLMVQPDVQFGSYGYQRQQLKAQGTFGRTGYLVNASRMRTDGFRTHSHAEIRKANIVVRTAPSADTEIRGVFNLFDMPFGESPSSLTRTDALNRPKSVRQQAIDQGWGESATQGQGGLAVEHHFRGDQVFRGTGWVLLRDLLNPIPNRVIDLGRVASGFRSEYGRGSRVGLLPFQWTAGVDVSYQRDDRAEFQNLGVPATGGRTREGPQLIDQLEQVLSVAPFAQVSVAFRTRWRLTAGARYDYYDFKAIDHLLTDGNQSGGRILHAASPKVGVTHAATNRLNIYANFATAYQTPTTVELSNRPSGEGGFNQDLEPADLRTFEMGARGLLERARLRYEVVGYRSTLKKALVPFQRPDEQTYYLNAGSSRRNGTEVLLEWTPMSRLKTRLAYTYQDFTFKRFVLRGVDYSGKHEAGAVPHQLFVGGSYATPFGLRSVVQLRWVDAYPVNNANTISNWSYRVVDLRFGLDRKWKSVDLRPFFGLDNLFNERYNGSTIPNAAGDRSFEPATDRAFYVGLTIGAGLL